MRARPVLLATLLLGAPWMVWAQSRGGGERAREGQPLSGWPTRLVAEPGKDWVELPAEASLPFRIEARGAAGVWVGVRLAGARTSLAERRDGLAFYREALGPGTLLVLSPLEEGVEDWVRLDEDRSDTELRYELSLGEGVAGLRLVGGVLELLDRQGAPRLHVPAPLVVDGEGRSHGGWLEVQGCEVDASPLPPWGRPPVAPGASECELRVRWPAGLAGPLWVDPTWKSTKSLATKRAYHGGSALADGRVLVSGGQPSSGGPLGSCEIYDPATSTWASTGALSFKRSKHNQLTLQDGKVFVVGGFSGNTPEAPETYDPATGVWTVSKQMPFPRNEHDAALLPDGRVLVVGGRTWDSKVFNSADIYNPKTNAWTSFSPMKDPRSVPALAVLDSGEVLVSGGVGVQAGSSLATAELLDPKTGKWTEVEPMAKGRKEHAAIALPGARALVVGGAKYDGQAAELFDSKTRTFSKVAPTKADRLMGIRGMAFGGTALMTGGYIELQSKTTGAVELYQDIPGGGWVTLAALPTHPYANTVTPLPWQKNKFCALMVGGLVTKDLSGDTGDARVLCGAPPGAKCAAASDCLSGGCHGGLCCDKVCTGCSSCLGALTGGADGLCLPVLAGTDPNEACAEGTTTCGPTGLCDGNGACASTKEGVPCGVETCIGQGKKGVPSCDGKGSCQTLSQPDSLCKTSTPVPVQPGGQAPNQPGGGISGPPGIYLPPAGPHGDPPSESRGACSAGRGASGAGGGAFLALLLAAALTARRRQAAITAATAAGCLLMASPARAADPAAPKVPIGLSNLVVRLDDKDEIGVAGLDIRTQLLERMRERGFEGVGAENLVFDKDESYRARAKLGGTVRDLKCIQRSSLLRCRVAVDWQLLDVGRDAVVYTARTWGVAIDVAEDKKKRIPATMVLGALDSLLAREKFRGALAEAGRDGQLAQDPAFEGATFARCPAPKKQMPEGAEEVLRSTVLVKTTTGHGSGFFVSSEGLVLTAAHVVNEGTVKLKLRDGSEIDAVPIRMAPRADVALLRPTRPLTGQSCLAIASSPNGPSAGSEVYVAGAPADLRLAFSLSRGIVSGIRDLDGRKRLQTDAAVSPGNSGGPIVDAQGQALAVVSSKLAGRKIEGVAFGVPITEALAAVGLSAGASTDAKLLAASALLPTRASSIEPKKDEGAPIPSLTPEDDRASELAKVERERRAQESRERRERIEREDEEQRREQERRESMRPPAPMHVKGLFLGGLGLTAAGATFGLVMYARYDANKTTEADYESLKTANTIGWAAAGVGVGVVVTSLVLRARARSSPGGQDTQRTLSLGPSGVTYGGTF